MRHAITQNAREAPRDDSEDESLDDKVLRDLDIGLMGRVPLLPSPYMVDTTPRQRNHEASWNAFSPDEYWGHNYCELQAEDQEIIHRVSRFFIHAFAGRDRACQAIDVGSGTNLYPALLMLPWAEQIQLTDFAESNVNWLRSHLADDGAPWSWQPFWDEMQKAARENPADYHQDNQAGYHRISEPRSRLRAACNSMSGVPRVRQCSVFDLRTKQWDLGTMFFVAESITEDPQEFRAAVKRFVRALKPGAPFAAAFMAESDGYTVGATRFPALRITEDDLGAQFTKLGASELSVELLKTEQRVRDGYSGMIVATGFARNR